MTLALGAIQVQVIGAVLLVLGLALHLTEVGFVGLAVVIFVTVFNGVTEEHRAWIAAHTEVLLVFPELSMLNLHDLG